MDYLVRVYINNRIWFFLKNISDYFNVLNLMNKRFRNCVEVECLK